MNNDVIGSLFPHNKWHSCLCLEFKVEWETLEKEKRKLFNWALVCSDSLHFSVSCLPSEFIWIPSRSPGWWGCAILGLFTDIHFFMGSLCCSSSVGMLLPPLHAEQVPRSHWPNAFKQCHILSGLVSSRMSLCAQGFVHKHAELQDGNAGLIHWWVAHSLHVNGDVENQGSFPTNAPPVTLLQVTLLFSSPNGILLQDLPSLSLLQGKNLFAQGVLNPFRTLQRLLPAYLPLELLHNLNHRVVLANCSPISL